MHTMKHWVVLWIEETKEFNYIDCSLIFDIYLKLVVAAIKKFFKNWGINGQNTRVKMQCFSIYFDYHICIICRNKWVLNGSESCHIFIILSKYLARKIYFFLMLIHYYFIVYKYVLICLVLFTRCFMEINFAF